jgi:hypothetical protein
VILAVLASALLPLYAAEQTGGWTYNQRFGTEMVNQDGAAFCVMRSAIITGSNGIEFRVGFAFGDRNEVSISSINPLNPSRATELEFGDGSIFDFNSPVNEKVGSANILRYGLSRSMMNKLLASLKGSEAAEIRIPLKFGVISGELPISPTAETYAGARACEDNRLGKVLPD